MQFYVGTSGYSYKAWKGLFYPEDLPARAMLHYYSQHFNAVEINSSYYRIPATSTLEAWKAEVPAHFRFILKASQRITHWQRLRGADDTLAYFLQTAAALGEQLGPILFQLGPGHRADPQVLADFLDLIPANIQSAFEFRHASWFSDAVFDLLRAHNAALCIAETDEKATPVTATANWGYLRLRRGDYDDHDLAIWLSRIQAFGWASACVFFKHEDEAHGPDFAARFQALAKIPSSE